MTLRPSRALALAMAFQFAGLPASLDAGPGLSPAQRHSRKEIVPTQGVFLVAQTDMQDPRFQRTVILLVKHDAEGTIGFIINRATNISPSDAIPGLDIPSSAHKLFFGGPVGLDGVLFLARSMVPLEGALHVMDDVYMSGDRKMLKDLLEKEKPAGELRLYFGYSGWAPGQLADEIDLGSWQVLRGNAHTVFAEDLDRIWRNLIQLSRPPSTLALAR